MIDEALALARELRHPLSLVHALLDQVGPDGIVITKRGKPVAKLIPVETESAVLIGTLKGKIKIRRDILATGPRWVGGKDYGRERMVQHPAGAVTAIPAATVVCKTSGVLDGRPEKDLQAGVYRSCGCKRYLAIQQPRATPRYLRGPSMTLTGIGVGATRVKVNPALSKSFRYSASVRSRPPGVITSISRSRGLAAFAISWCTAICE